jgi:4-hydroxy-4-methyl-2-oxoglutarate aldolase
MRCTGWMIIALALSPGHLLAQRPAFSSSDAADAAERLTKARAHMDGAMQRLSGSTVAGPAVTMRLVRDDGASLTVEGLKAIQMLEQSPPGSVIVACSDANADFAVFGPTFATLAKARGLAGFVVDGAMRGLSDLRRIGVPVFARGVVPGSAGGHYRLDAVNVPMSCAGVDVSPGDIVVGDEDGVAVIPKAVANDAIARARALRDEKEAMLPLIARYKSYTKAVEEYRRRSGKPH